MCRCLIVQNHGGRVVGRAGTLDVARAAMDALHPRLRSLYRILPMVGSGPGGPMPVVYIGGQVIDWKTKGMENAVQG